LFTVPRHAAVWIDQIPIVSQHPTTTQRTGGHVVDRSVVLLLSVSFVVSQTARHNNFSPQLSASLSLADTCTDIGLQTNPVTISLLTSS